MQPDRSTANVLRPRVLSARLCGAILLLLSSFSGLVKAQTTISVTDPVRSSANGSYLWVPLTAAGGGGTIATDATGDVPSTKKTYSYQYDYVGTTSQAGFLIKFGQVAGVDYVGFSLMASLYDTTFSGSYGSFGIGFETNRDGNVDFALNVNPTGTSNAVIAYEYPTSNANNGGIVFGGNNNISSTYFDYRAVTNSTDALYPGWTTLGGQTDAMITFLVPLSAINTALTGAGLSAITSSTLIRLVAFSTTDKKGLINQDIYGATLSSTAQFDAAGGGYTEYTDLTGRPIPEPATLASVGFSLLGGLLIWRRRRTSASPWVPAARET